MPLYIPPKKVLKPYNTVEKLTSYLHGRNGQKFSRSECREVAEKVMRKSKS